MTTSIRCPHDLEVSVGQTSGITFYYHPDGKPCEPPNRFDTTTTHLLNLMVGDDFSPGRWYVVYPAFAASRIIRVKFYTSLTGIPAKELATRLNWLATWLCKLSAEQKTLVIAELHVVFGRVAWDNLEYIAAGSTTGFAGIEDPGVLRLELPQLMMKSLKDEETSSAFLDIDKAVNNLKKPRRNW